MTNEELSAIEERADKASTGPWTTEAGGPYALNINVDARLAAASLRVVDPRRLSRYGIIPLGILFRDDALFVARAREDVPALVAEVRRLRAVVTAAEAFRDTPHGHVPSQRALCEAVDAYRQGVTDPVDEAIKIILKAMREVDDEHAAHWYLPWMRLHKAVYYLTDVRYGLV